MPKISVVIAAYNMESYIENCIRSLLMQSYRDFEIIISDDNSTDRTKEIIRSFKDKRVKLLENKKRNHISENRNIAIRSAKGKYIFFTDADCIINRYWIEEGVRILEEEDVAGVRGHTIYENPFPTIRNRVTTFDGESNHYATCNIAYVREHLETTGYFNPSLKYGREDTDIAMKVMKIGEIKYSPNMIIIHRERPWRFSGNIEYSDLYYDSEVVFLKRHPDYRTGIKIGKLRILCPEALLCILFPPLLLFYFRLRRPGDLLLLPLRWIKFIIQRFIIIKAAIRERVLIL